MKKALWGVVGLLLVLLAGAVARRASRAVWRVPKAGSTMVIPVFALHRVLPGEASEYIMGPEHLDALIDELQRRGFTPISVAQLRAGLRREGPLPRRPAMLTFDDAYLDNYVHALPVLKKRRWPAVFFVPVGKITDPPAARTAWGDGPEPVAMQWPEIIALKEAGMEIGSHALQHINLAKADPEAVETELVESRRILAERIGVAPLALSYPGGRHSREVRQAAAAAGYGLAFLSGGGPIPLNIEDLYALPRVHVPGYVDARAIVRAIPENVPR